MGCNMRRSLIAAFTLLAMSGSATAQDSTATRADTCQKIGMNVSGSASAREGIYASATCIAARAGLSSSTTAPLTQQELVSILLLMTAQPAPKGNAS